MSVMLLYVLFSMFAVMYYDATRFIIPNWLVGGLLIAYPLAVLLSPVAVDWKNDLMAMLLVFAIGYVVFALRVMGGGDVKLIIVLSLWVGWNNLYMFGFYFAVLGGILSIIILLLRKVVPFIVKDTKTLPRIFKNKEPVPYGLAIAGAFLLMVFQEEIAMFNYLV